VNLTYDVRTAGTVTALWAETDAPGGTNVVTITVRKNGSTTAGDFISCTVTGTETACEATGSIAVVDGDFLTVIYKETVGNPADKPAKAYVVLNQQ
jgi:hypothetical protein